MAVASIKKAKVIKQAHACLDRVQKNLDKLYEQIETKGVAQAA
jgi:hypothetical protein